MTDRSDDSSRSTSRRRVLGQLAGVGGLAASGLLPGLGQLALAAPLGVGPAGATPARVLRHAASAEALQLTLYYAVLSGAAFHMNAAATDQLRLMLDTEQQHLGLLRRLGAAPQAGPYALPEDLLTDARVFVQTAQQLKSLATSAYFLATHQLAAAGQPALAATAAQLAASEAQHQAVLAHLAGLDGPQASLPAADFRRPAEVAAALAPFLRPNAVLSARLPSADQLRAVLDGRSSLPGRPYAQPGRGRRPT